MRAGLIPVLLSAREAAIEVHWADLGQEPWREPFFEQTVQERLRGGSLLTSDLAALAEQAREHPGVTPSGFIFHTSRCGSSLVTRMLGTLDRAIVLGEPAILHQVLTAGDDLLAPAARLGLLRQVINGLGQRRSGVESLLVVKFTSSDVLRIGLVRAAFPGVPWVYLHRDPVEVLVSILASPTGWLRERWTRPLPLAGLTAAELAVLSDEEYAVQAVAAFARAALDAMGPGAEAIDYRLLPAAVIDTVAPLFKVELSAGERRRMLAASAADAKDPAGREPFVPDGDRKQARASPRLRQLAHEWIGDLAVELGRRAAPSSTGPVPT